MFDGNLPARVIYRILSADAALTALHKGVVEDIWKRDESAPDSAFPFTSFSLLDEGQDRYFNGASRALTEYMVLVRGIQKFTGDASWGGTLQSIADRIDTLLHNKTVTITDTNNTTPIGTAYIYRISPYRDRFIEGDTEYRYLGGIYSVSTNEL